MEDAKLMESLKNHPISFPDGWDDIVLSYCKSFEMEDFGQGVVHNLVEAINIADEMDTPFTAMHVVTILMMTIGVLIKAFEPPEHVVLAIRISLNLLHDLIENPATLKEAKNFLDTQYSEFLLRFEWNAKAYYDYLRVAFYGEKGTTQFDTQKLDEFAEYRLNSLDPEKFVRDMLGSTVGNLGKGTITRLGIALKEHLRNSTRDFFNDDVISVNLRSNQLIVQQLLYGLPEEFRPKATNTIIGFLPLFEPNAQAIRAPNGEPLVILDQGIYASLWHFAETRATLPVIARQEGDTAFAKFLIWRCYQQVMYFKNPGSPWLRKPTKNREDLSLLTMHSGITEAMERFVVAHELAHIYAGHMTTTRHMQQNPKQAKYLEDIEFFQKSQEQEYEADRLAFSWYLKSLEGSETISVLDLFDDDLAKVAPLYIFVLFHLIEKNMREEHHRYSTHPPAELRMKNLIDHFKNNFSEEELQKCSETMGYIGIMPKFSLEQLDDPSLLRKELGFSQAESHENETR